MNTTTYKKYASFPIKNMQVKPAYPVNNTIDVRSEKHPVREEIKKFCETAYDIKVSFQEDAQTLNYFPHIPGLIAILCTLTSNGQIISFGRSCAVFDRINKYVERTISTVINGSFLSACNNATKVFGALRIREEKEQNIASLNKNKIMPTKTAIASFEPRGYSSPEDSDNGITEKQKAYLLQLVLAIDNPEDREKHLAQLDSGLSRYDASELISNLVQTQS